MDGGNSHDITQTNQGRVMSGIYYRAYLQYQSESDKVQLLFLFIWSGRLCKKNVQLLATGIGPYTS